MHLWDLRPCKLVALAWLCSPLPRMGNRLSTGSIIMLRVVLDLASWQMLWGPIA